MNIVKISCVGILHNVQYFARINYIKRNPQNNRMEQRKNTRSWKEHSAHLGQRLRE